MPPVTSVNVNTKFNTLNNMRVGQTVNTAQKTNKNAQHITSNHSQSQTMMKSPQNSCNAQCSSNACASPRGCSSNMRDLPRDCSLKNDKRCLKVCSFNARYDGIELCERSCSSKRNNCHPCSPKRDNCGSSNRRTQHTNKVPDSLLAALIAINILPTKADVYNIQNIANKCVVQHLLKELYRVRNITKYLKTCTDSCDDQCNEHTESYYRRIACKLNELSGLCPEDIYVRDSLACLGLSGLEYVPENSTGCDHYYKNAVLKYAELSEYEAYFNGTCLSLVAKTCSVTETYDLSGIDGIFLFLNVSDVKYVICNINIESPFRERDVRCARAEKVVCFLKQYEKCGSIILNGALGDIDYDINQLLFNADCPPPEYVKNELTLNEVCNVQVPSDYPCDITNPIYDSMKYFLSKCKADKVTYACLLQYLRLNSKQPVVCAKKTCNTDSYRKAVYKDDCVSRYSYSTVVKECQPKTCQPKTCPPKTCPPKTCPPKCPVKCNKYEVTIDVCSDLCKSSCCAPCSNNKTCEEQCDDVCVDPCKDFKYRDPCFIFENNLCLFNTLSMVEEVNDRYTGFYNNFNKCLDCKYPKGQYQAFALCKDYTLPVPKRTINNNSELLATDHFFVSNCIKNNVSYVTLSELDIRICDQPVSELEGNVGMDAACDPDKFVFQYAGSKVKSFFINRMYCALIDNTCKTEVKTKQCDNVGINALLHNLGLPQLWDSLCTIGCDNVSIDTFALFNLDKHPYFVDFFWKQLFNPLYDYRNNTTLMSIQKRSCMNECEFYTHLACVLTKCNKRDEYIVNIAFMESLLRTNKMKSFISDNTYVLMHNKNTVNDLFTYLTVCFGNVTDPCCVADNITSIDYVIRLIFGMTPWLINNCLLMSVVIKHVINILYKLVAEYGLNSLPDYVNWLFGYPAGNKLLKDIVCGKCVNECSITALITELGDDAGYVLFGTIFSDVTYMC